MQTYGLAAGRIGKMAGGPSVAVRKRLAAKGKAEPGGGYPTDTKGRAVAAKGRATQAVKAGRMSAGKKAEIDARANRELGGRRGLINS